jgi:hypothetical protein
MKWMTWSRCYRWNPKVTEAEIDQRTKAAPVKF